jgi:glycine/D-amino acid oxidase-like deaminating enzyme
MTAPTVSLWNDTVPESVTPRPALDGDTVVDVAIIGAGLTGIWTAYYLQKRDPGLRIALLDKNVAGFGASGRNGGWASALFPQTTSALVSKYGFDAAKGLRDAMVDSIGEIGRVIEAEHIDCDFARVGTLIYARTPLQEKMLRAEVAETQNLGIDALDWVDAAQVHAAGARGATFTHDCARIHPAKLVTGMARTVEQRGATIYEHTTVESWSSGRVVTDRGVVTARHIVNATEGYGASIAQTHRRILPLYSLMIATAPLPDSVWDEIGLQHGHTFSDGRNLIIYGQRTADNRFAFGGRGARYHLGSAIKPEYDQSAAVFGHLERTLSEMFPQAGTLEVTHRWGGPLGVPRDWHAHVAYDHESGIGSAGGYVGDGLTTTNLAGRTLADLITRTDSHLTRLPWVGHHSPDWELEPLRFIGANMGLIGMTAADAEENATGRPSIIAKLLAPLTGH